MAIKDLESIPAPSVIPPRILYLDAYDSFSNNIIAQVEICLNAKVSKLYIDDPRFQPGAKPALLGTSHSFHEYLKQFDAVIAGPGPGTAIDDKDVGLMKELWKLQDADLLPVFGICLGFQSMAVAFGADIETLKEPKHGLVSEILHKGRSIFIGVNQLLATQYHSLQVNIEHPIQIKRAVRYPGELWCSTGKCPDIEPLAWDFDNRTNGAVLMAFKHAQKPFWGVQFHPESICTNDEGKHMIQNWWKCAQTWITKHAIKSTPISATVPLSVLEYQCALSCKHISEVTQPLVASVRGTQSDTIFRKTVSTLDPERLAKLIRNGDSHSLPNLPPDVVHCATTGSGRLAVADVCNVFNIPRSEAIILESGLQADLLPLKVGTGRYSIIGLVIPRETLRLHYYTDTKLLQLRDGNNSVYTETLVDNVWSYIKTVMKHLKPKREPSGPTFAPFWGGLMGYVSYEAGLEQINVLPAAYRENESAVPDICFAYITRTIVFDHQVKKIYVQSIRCPDDKPWVSGAVERIYEAVGYKSAVPTPSPMPRPNPFDSMLKDPVIDTYLDPNKTLIAVADRAGYSCKVSKCQNIISKGHSYELCLTTTNEIRAPKSSSADSPSSTNELSWKLYSRLVKQNPAPFSAYIRLHNLHILSSSPERYISWDRNGSAQCRPIKGTVRKLPGVTQSDALAILSSPKERAENLMIVDLVRHQLHGVYGAGNVRVTQLMNIEEYETLWQLVSVIDAVPPGVQKARTPDEWEEPADYVSGRKASPETSSLGFEAFVQSLPPGSMTGAPKKRSCEILKDLEGEKRRGVYSGVLGYLDVGGGGDFSVVIRTAVKIDSGDNEKEDVWRIGAGGAVTAQSIPEAEYEEMCGKFSSTARAFNR
ncbi:para-aminobenzoate synthase [Lojkania enalia]|uniref:aminodeoxychorismate synthase n=1 Tax=Lojkania enalia TaxID=147567 RepID=A0A9P4K7I9_9PLEO|nr:para-aminobenzoate synthase [Didymosphaeria enalia]